MNKQHILRTAVAVLALAVWLPSHAHETSVKETAKEVGRSAASAGREVGHGAKKAGKAVGKVAKDGVEAAKQGGREVKRAIVGD
jgi:hypothetical protein